MVAKSLLNLLMLTYQLHSSFVDDGCKVDDVDSSVHRYILLPPDNYFFKDKSLHRMK